MPDGPCWRSDTLAGLVVRCSLISSLGWDSSIAGCPSTVRHSRAAEAHPLVIPAWAGGALRQRSWSSILISLGLDEGQGLRSCCGGAGHFRRSSFPRKRQTILILVWLKSRASTPPAEELVTSA